MVGVAFRFDGEGVGPASAALARLAHPSAREMLLEAAGAILESSTRERFETKTAPDGEPWAEWSERTARQRDQRHSLLVYEGALRDSIAWEIGAGATLLEIGSPLVYAAVHQLGLEDDEGGRTMPARPYLGLSDADRAAIEAAAQQRLSRLLEGR